MTAEASFHRATSLPDAIGALRERGTQACALAGGTWLMRSTLRGETMDRAYVSLSGIDALRRVTVGETELDIGACVTHTELASALEGRPGWQALGMAAAASANPAVRNVATVGGNLCATNFAAADLVPALMSLDASVELEGPDGRDRLPLERFMASRASIEPGRVVRRVLVPRPGAGSRSAHARLPLRQAGDYPVAIVSIAVAMKPDRTVERARVTVGSVERDARRWHRLEAALVGHALDVDAAIRQAGVSASDFVGRDGVEAPGWYRVQVLPTLVGRAVRQLLQP